MEIGTIGAGALARAFAKQALKAGHKVKLSNHHGPDSLREVINQLGPGATAATKEEAAACEMAFLAVPWDNVPETLASLPKWNNQILIDGTNPFHGRAGKFTLADVGNLSTSQFIAGLALGSRVVKALNTITFHTWKRILSLARPEESCLFRETTTARKKKSKRCLPASAIRSSILETFVMAG
jgi:8-hydroxy-5-deazaflavin:NADPH oxidoreductase